MSRHLAALAVAVLLSGCMIGPSPRVAPIPASASVGATRLNDSARAFFDSLSAARAADTTAPLVARVSARTLPVDSLADLGWLGVLRDTTLNRLVATALRQNRTLAAVRASIRESQAEYGMERSALFPSATANGSWSENKVAFGSLAIPAYAAWRATADVSWQMNFWEVGRGLEAARADLGGHQAAARAAVISLVSSVATGYLQLLELDQEQAIAERTLSSAKATLALARERYARGVISELDVRQFEAEVAVPAARLAQVTQMRTQQEHALDVLLGEGPVPIPRGGSLVEAARAVVVPDSVPAALLARRPDVEEARQNFAAATARIGMADAARLPALSIAGSYGTQSRTLGAAFGTNTRIYQAMVGISVPLSTGGRLANETRAARAQAEQAADVYRQTLLIAMEEAGDALAGVRAARDVAAAEETQAAALRRAFDLAEIRYQTGLSNYLDVLDAQRSLFAAQIAASQAQLGQLTATIKLYKALGGSWPGMEALPAH